MRILFVHLHFKNPKSGGALRSFYLASELAKRGFEIEVVTAHNLPNYEKVDNEGVTIHYLPVSYDNAFGSMRRILSFVAFNRKAARLIRSLPRPDLLYCISTPLTVGLVGIRMKKELGIPFYFEVGDLWPEAPIQMNVIKNAFLKKRLYSMEEKIYRESSTVVALSPPIRDSILSRFPGVRVIMHPNMSDIDFFAEAVHRRSSDILPSYSIRLGYIGAIGRANHIEFMLEAARHIQEIDPRIGFVIMGEGSELERLQLHYQPVANIQFLPFSNKELVRETMTNLEAIYISYKDLPVLETGCPNKFFDAIAAGKLIILNFGGWLAELIEEHEIGFRYDPHNPEELYERLQPYVESPELLERVKNNATALAREYSVEKLMDKLASQLSASEVTS